MAATLEKVARVLNPAAFKPPLDKPGHQLVREGQRRLALERARAVLKAIRDPSVVMVEAGYDTDRGFCDEPGKIGTPEQVWRAMIDTALSED